MRDKATERIAIMGSSGSGKSTLLHLFAGLDLQTGGTLQWPALGERKDLRPGKVSIALQVQSLVPFLSVAENIALPLFVLGNTAEASTTAAAALEQLGLADLAERLPTKFLADKRSVSPLRERWRAGRGYCLPTSQQGSLIR